MRILVIDGQSGRLGCQLIEGLKKAGLSKIHQVLCVGANALATSAMLKAGADSGATGENPTVFNCRKADVITGPLGIMIADALMGEITPPMALAVSQSDAVKVLLPVSKCGSIIVGVQDMPRSQLVEEAVRQILALCEPN